METIRLEYHEKINGVSEKRELVFSSSLIRPPFLRTSLFVIRVDGRSMEPLIGHDALVVADLSQKDYEEGAIFLVYQDDRMWIKKASIVDNTECFVSLNKGYEHLVYSASEVRIIAKALLTFTAL